MLPAVQEQSRGPACFLQCKGSQEALHASWHSQDPGWLQVAPPAEGTTGEARTAWLVVRGQTTLLSVLLGFSCGDAHSHLLGCTLRTRRGRCSGCQLWGMPTPHAMRSCGSSSHSGWSW